MRRTLNFLSWAAIGLVAFGICALFVGYTIQINRPMQGGWNAYRIREFVPQILPYVLLLLGLVGTRARNCPRWLIFLGMTLVLLGGAYLCLLYLVFAFEMHNPGTLAGSILLGLSVGGHIAYLANRGSVRNVAA